MTNNATAMFAFGFTVTGTAPVGIWAPGAITQGATGPEISLSGRADDAYDFVIEVTTGGALDVGEFRAVVLALDADPAAAFAEVAAQLAAGEG